MPIHTIRNNTGGRLQLWDVGTMLADLGDGDAIQFLHIVIIRVTLNGVEYPHRHGAFRNGDSYSATFLPAVSTNPATVMFAGNEGNVSFT